MSLPVPIGYVFLAVGGVLVAVGTVANRYHSRRFDAHTDRLSRFSQADDEAAIREEVRAFHEDRRVDVATRLLIAEPIGVVVLITGLFFVFL